MSRLKGGCMCGQISYDSDAAPAMTAQAWVDLGGEWDKVPRNPPFG